MLGKQMKLKGMQAKENIIYEQVHPLSHVLGMFSVIKQSVFQVGAGKGPLCQPMPTFLFEEHPKGDCPPGLHTEVSPRVIQQKDLFYGYQPIYFIWRDLIILL